MNPPRTVFVMRMIKGATAMAMLGTLVFLGGCGQVVPLEDRACPCASGWTCCSGTCVAGSDIDLGTQSIADEPDASIVPGVERVTGLSAGALGGGAPVQFDYATSIWPTPAGWQFKGWLVSASAGQSFNFESWTEQDGGAVPLPLVAYGPLEAGDAGICGGALQSSVMLGSQVTWTAGEEGTYFVAPYHQVSETASGLAFQGLDNALYADAFLVMNPVE
jgi:hypothetical protein